MPLLLSHNSALERIRSVPPQVDGAAMVPEPVFLANVIPSRHEIVHLDPHGLGLRQRPVHVLVPARHRISKSPVVAEHHTRLESVPEGLVRIVDEGVFTAGPELCFAQMALQLSDVGAVVLGYELCGTYSHFSQLVSGFYDRPAITRVARIEHAIGQLGGMYGLSSAQRALRWVRDGSASPMETVVSCMLHLPSRMGGFGFRAPELNCQVRLDAAAQRITGTAYAKVDAGYPGAEIGFEFDGEEYHRDAEKDRRRREALAHMGWTIYVLNVDEATDYRILRDKVALMSNVPRQRGTRSVTAEEGRGLLERLLRATRFGLGLNAALFGAPVPRGRVRLHV